jgi:hypothetical protein
MDSNKKAKEQNRTFNDTINYCIIKISGEMTGVAEKKKP